MGPPARQRAEGFTAERRSLPEYPPPDAPPVPRLPRLPSWVLLTDARSTADLYDLATATRVYQSTEVTNVTFWPRLSTGVETVGGHHAPGPALPLRRAKHAVRGYPYPMSRPFFTAALLFIAGCTRTASGWHPARDPATLGETTLSAFQDVENPPGCNWMQIDPLGGSRQTLLAMDSECIDPRAVISPDGRWAAVSSQDNDGGPLYEVSLVTGAWRALPPGPGTIDKCFWREGVLYLVATWEEPPSWLTRLGLSAANGQAMTSTFRLDGRSWIRSEEPMPDREVLNLLDSSSMTRAVAEQDLPEPSKKMKHRLEQKYGEGHYREIAPTAFIGSDDDGLEGPLVFLRPDGALETPDGVVASTLRDSTYVQVRGQWLLTTTGGSNPVLYDLTTGTLVYQSQEPSNVTFWPRLSTAPDTIGGHHPLFPPRPRRQCKLHRTRR